MGRKTLPAKLLREMARLCLSGATSREINKALQVSQKSASSYATIIRNKGLTWSDIERLNDEQLIELVRGKPKASIENAHYLEPDYPKIFSRLKNNDLKTIDDAFTDYLREAQLSGKKHCSRTTFFDRYKSYRETLKNPTNDCYFSHDWKPGECVQIDYAGDTLPMRSKNNPEETIKVPVFVSVLPFSRYVFACATKDQTRESWLDAMSKMLANFSGVPRILMLDNSTSLVNHASRYVPTISQELTDFGTYYNIDIQAVAPSEPTYKGSVENAVKQVQNGPMDNMRSVPLFSLKEINEILGREIERLNGTRMRSLGGVTRKELFEIERKTLCRLPGEPFKVGVRLKLYKVGLNYCIRIRGHNYSVPYKYAHRHVLVGIYPGPVLKIFDDQTQELIATHTYYGERRDMGFTHIKDEHRPPNHPTASQRLETARSLLSNSTETIMVVVDQLLETLHKSSDDKKANLLFGFNNLRDKYGLIRLDKACKKALLCSNVNYGFIKKMLETHTEDEPAENLLDQEMFSFMKEGGYVRDDKEFKKLLNHMRTMQ